MHPDYVLGIDLNLLKVFSAIYRERHLTRAGERIGLTQPAMSQALRRLRSHFSDELFIRSSGGMRPTVLADDLIGPVNRALNLISGALSGQREFEPGTAERTLRIGTNEFVSIYLMPTVMRIVRRAAPGIILQAINLPSWQAPSRSAMNLSSQTFIDNRLDLIVLPWIRHNDEVRSTELYSEPSIVLASAANRMLGDPLTIDEYVAVDHVATSTFGANRTYLDDILAAMGLKRRVVLWTPHVFASIEAVVACDLICSIPTTIAMTAATQRPGLRTSPLPFEAPPRPIFSYWMTDRASDPALGWIRSVFDGAARDLAARSPSSGKAAAE